MPEKRQLEARTPSTPPPSQAFRTRRTRSPRASCPDRSSHDPCRGRPGWCTLADRLEGIRRVRPHAARPGVVAADADPAHGAARRRQLQPVVILGAGVVVDIERADQGRLPRILLIQHTPHVHVGVGRAHRVEHAVERAGTGPHVDRRVERRQRPEPIRVSPEITHCHAPVVSDLPLQRHVPVLHARGVDVRVHHAEGAEAHEVHVAIRHDRMRIPARE